MASSPTEIPEWNKTMNYLFGEKLGRFLSRTMVLGLWFGAIAIPIVLVLANIKGAIENIGNMLSKISSVLPSVLNSPILNAIASIIILVVGFAAMFAVLTLIAAVPAQFIRTLFDTNYRIRINDTLIGLLDILRKAKQGDNDKEMMNQLLSDTEYLFSRWQQTKTNRVMHWILPEYFKKGSEKWKIVSKTELDKIKSKKKG